MSPRERFVEAIRYLENGHECEEPEDKPCRMCKSAIQAVEAFADAVCEAWADGTRFGSREGEGDSPKEHAACRAALLKECGI